MRRPSFLLVLLGSLLATALLSGCDSAGPDTRIDVSIIELIPGSGAEAVEGSTVTVHYIGKFDNGDIFDSSLAAVNERLDADRPFTFTLGDDLVIQGWERGVPGMRVGGKRRLIIPPELAYGSRGVGCPSSCNVDGSGCEACIIPPNARLTFDIDLIEALPVPRN